MFFNVVQYIFMFMLVYVKQLYGALGYTKLLEPDSTQNKLPLVQMNGCVTMSDLVCGVPCSPWF